MAFDLKDFQRRMQGALEALKGDFSGLRTGRASSGLLEPITVDAYGAMLPLNQVATVSVLESRMLSVQVWDRALAQAVDKAIRTSGLGLNPILEGQVIRVPVPDLSSERRKELTKVAHQYAEKARVAVRNVRRDAMDLLKRLEKDKTIGEDEYHQKADDVQKLTDRTIKEIDDTAAHKEREILSV